MKTVLLKFTCLSDLALFCKQIQHGGYVINTASLTLSVTPTVFELALAKEQFQAVEINKQVIV